MRVCVLLLFSLLESFTIALATETIRTFIPIQYTGNIAMPSFQQIPCVYDPTQLYYLRNNDIRKHMINSSIYKVKFDEVHIGNNWFMVHPRSRSTIWYESLFSKNTVRPESEIENENIPSCKHCIFHEPYFNSEYASISSKCNKFGEKNILTDKIDYEYISTARKDETKCGIRGRCFQPDPNFRIKEIRHSLIKNSWYIFPISLAILTNYIRLFS